MSQLCNINHIVGQMSARECVCGVTKIPKMTRVFLTTDRVIFSRSNSQRASRFCLRPPLSERNNDTHGVIFRNTSNNAACSRPETDTDHCDRLLSPIDCRDICTLCPKTKQRDVNFSPIGIVIGPRGVIF